MPPALPRPYRGFWPTRTSAAPERQRRPGSRRNTPARWMPCWNGCRLGLIRWPPLPPPSRNRQCSDARWPPMRAPEFWHEPPGLIAGLLAPFGIAFDAASRLRRAVARPYRAPVPVICVGNLVAGGSGTSKRSGLCLGAPQGRADAGAQLVQRACGTDFGTGFLLVGAPHPGLYELGN